MSTNALSHSLTLEIPSPLYASLVDIAAQNGQQPEEWALAWLATTLQQCHDDPVEAFIGAFRSDRPDWVDRHDAYLAQALVPEHSFTLD